MTEFRCTKCGTTMLPPPGAVGPQTCRHCGGTVLPTLRPVGGRGAAGGRARQPSWARGLRVLLPLAAIVALVLGIKCLIGTSEAGAVMAGAGEVPLRKLAVPLRARVAVSQRGRQVRLVLLLADARGTGVRSVYLTGGRRADEPEVSIVDERGAVVYQCRLSYG